MPHKYNKKLNEHTKGAFRNKKKCYDPSDNRSHIGWECRVTITVTLPRGKNGVPRGAEGTCFLQKLWLDTFFAGQDGICGYQTVELWELFPLDSNVDTQTVTDDQGLVVGYVNGCSFGFNHSTKCCNVDTTVLGVGQVVRATRNGIPITSKNVKPGDQAHAVEGVVTCSQMTSGGSGDTPSSLTVVAGNQVVYSDDPSDFAAQIAGLDDPNNIDKANSIISQYEFLAYEPTSSGDVLSYHASPYHCFGGGTAYDTPEPGWSDPPPPPEGGGPSTPGGDDPKGPTTGGGGVGSPSTPSGGLIGTGSNAPSTPVPGVEPGGAGHFGDGPGLPPGAPGGTKGGEWWGPATGGGGTGQGGAPEWWR